MKILGYVDFSDGSERAVYASDGRHFVIDDAGEVVPCVWWLEPGRLHATFDHRGGGPLACFLTRSKNESLTRTGIRRQGTHRPVE